MLWAVGMCTVTGGFSFSSRVSRRVSPTVPGWRVAKANTHTVTPDTQNKPRIISAVTRNALPSSVLNPYLSLTTTLRSLSCSLDFKVLSLALTAPWGRRPCLVLLCVPHRNEQRALHGRKHSNHVSHVSRGRPRAPELIPEERH